MKDVLAWGSHLALMRPREGGWTPESSRTRRLQPRASVPPGESSREDPNVHCRIRASSGPTAPNPCPSSCARARLVTPQRRCSSRYRAWRTFQGMSAWDGSQVLPPRGSSAAPSVAPGACPLPAEPAGLPACILLAHVWGPAVGQCPLRLCSSLLCWALWFLGGGGRCYIQRQTGRHRLRDWCVNLVSQNEG